MNKYSEGDVSAILCQRQPPVNSIIVDKDRDSERRSRYKIARPLSSSSDENFNNSNRLKRKNGENEVSNDCNNRCMKTNTDLTLKKRKTLTKKKLVINDIGNTSPDNENQTDVTINERPEVRIERECKIVGACSNEISKNFQYTKSFKRRNDISNDSNKSEFTIFVGNMPLSYDHKKVVKIFSKFGEVENARIRCVPVANPSIKKKTSVITKKFHPNRDSAVAYVVFKSKESVAKATAQNGMVLNGHHLRIDSAVPQKRDPKKCVFVGSLPFDIRDDELWDLFKDCGEIEGVRVIRDKNVSMGKGFGYVNFISSASVELALKLNGKEIRKQKINVERFIQKKEKRSDLTGSFINGKQRKWQNENVHALKPRKKTKNSCPNEFQGRIAQKKSKKKKSNRTNDEIRKNRIRSILLSTSSCGKDKAKTGVIS